MPSESNATIPSTDSRDDSSEQSPSDIPSTSPHDDVASSSTADVTTEAEANTLTDALETTAQHALPDSFTDTTADDIRALTRALTTPIEQIESDDHAAAAAAVAAVAASVAAGARSEHATEQQSTETVSVSEADAGAETLDVNNVYNQVLSLAAQSQKPSGKRADQEIMEQNNAARALQLIALSLSNAASQPGDLSGAQEGDQTSESLKTESEQTVEPTPATFEQALKEHFSSTSAAPDASDTLLAISNAINFQSQPPSKLEEDTKAFAQAVLNATHVDANKTSDSITSESHQDALDALHNIHLNTTSASEANTGAASAVASSSAPSSSQGFTFEIDKATGKTQIKWESNTVLEDSRQDPSVSNSVLQDATAIQQALHTLIANSGIPGLSDLGVASGGLLAPPLGQFPAQGSQFGTAQDYSSSEPTAEHQAPPPPKKRRTGGSSTQNTAASIPEGATSYPCTFPGCDKVFARLYNLKSHSRTHSNEKPFVCSHCKIAFSRNHDLKRHVKIHGGDKPFKCNGCGKSFSRLDALGRHRNNQKNRAGCHGGAEGSADA